ncbi:hypothetical protein PHLGIDRAFT_506289 [Phlebiopsis gigantea 11061_1 CR5-6]|uniref:Uncharacterized protein n=1 Tax=Phlebiopsis gigantea (strain 11061_1 CR5-6) TaxID=745531 RepID=A0A0C3S1K5_PHLG1|nr:hypothetical protein PHLGIDRAFT_506289 [Phlebiopsis gigantea 11061_1 CR5-6]
MSHEKQFTLYTVVFGSNGWSLRRGDLNKLEHKEPEFTQYNPNARAPTLIDHSHKDFVIWWNELGIELYVANYHGFNCEQDFPGVYRGHQSDHRWASLIRLIWEPRRCYMELCNIPFIRTALRLREKLLLA